MQRTYCNNNLLILAMIYVAVSSLISHLSGQNCGCSSNLCCSQYGYCGTGDGYCGSGCQSGPCYNSSSGGGNSVSVADIVTDSFFDGILSGAASNCEGVGFYTRSAFLSALGPFPAFGTTGTVDVQKQEIAAFFAIVAYMTGGMCCINGSNGQSQNYCDPSSTKYPCVSGQYYYGRGPLQLTWNYNYGAAGNDLNFDGLGDPDAVASDPVLSFETALWIWMGNFHEAITSGQGFCAAFQDINGPSECGGGNPVNYYTQFCQELGVSPGDNLNCSREY